MKNNVTMIIMSCDAFSDLWDGHVKLLEKNWYNRDMETVIVTDKRTDKNYDRVKVFCPEEGLEWSERLKAAVQKYNTDYYFITLDDYYLINFVDNQKISSLISIIDKENIDYMRFFKHPVKATGEAFQGQNDLRWINTQDVYSVNLYSGIWKKEFLIDCIDVPMDAWKFEVSLFRKAQEYNAKCLVDLSNDFEILDVVRKGKLIRKSGRYIKRNGLYTGGREMNSVWFEAKLAIKVFARRYLPSAIRPWVRKVAIKLGMRSYSAENTLL